MQYGQPLRDQYAGYNALLMPMLEPTGDLAGKTPPASPRPPRPLGLYAGRYENDYYGPARITVENSNLILTLGPRDTRYVLTHWDGDIFALAPDGENAPKGSRSSVDFSTRDGREIFTIQNLSEDNMAVWTR